jgi:hypothetical protein
MVRGRLIKGYLQEPLEGDLAIDLVFQLRVGINMIPFLEKKTFQQYQGRIGICTFLGRAYGIMTYQHCFHLWPVNHLIDLFQSLEASVIFHGGQ